MEQDDAPKIEFPCDYPIKVLGRSVAEFESTILEVFERHAPGFERDRISSKVSREGNFVSLTIFITATGKPQLEALHEELLATGLVQMVI
jgi:putative lipoic acid-binding regulatory protein